MAESKQLCEDIASYMIIAMRENRYFVYSYLFLSRLLPLGISTKNKVNVEQMHGQKIAKSTEYVNNQGDGLVSYADLPFS